MPRIKNAGGEANKTGPRMLIRLVAGVLRTSNACLLRRN